MILRPLPMIVGALAAAAVLLVALVLDEDEAPESDGGGFGGAPVDPYAPQETNHPGVCDPTAKPGVLLFRQWVIDKWGERPKSPQNIVRACSEGKSEHEQGRAWDMMTNSLEHGQAVVDALLAPDPDTGEPHALARRAGIMYIIWNKQIWRAYPYAGAPSGSWGPYTGGESAHSDHLHISFSKAGADGLTSLYDRIRQEFPNA